MNLQNEQLKKNFPNTIQLGDIKDWENWNIDWKSIQIIFAGSPCQGFSFAGRQLAFEDDRSKLFFKFVQILEHCKKQNPGVFFLFENVRMNQKSKDVITEYLNVEPKEIDSGIVCAQQRKRLYWTNLPFEDIKPNPTNPKLGDILENKCGTFAVDKKYYLTEEQILKVKNVKSAKTFKTGNSRGSMNFPNRLDWKSLCLTTSNGSGRLTNFVDDGFGIRKLTPLEWERLQTLPDNYTKGESDTQRYKMCGNGWNMKTVAHFFKGLKIENNE